MSRTSTRKAPSPAPTAEADLASLVPALPETREALETMRRKFAQEQQDLAQREADYAEAAAALSALELAPRVDSKGVAVAEAHAKAVHDQIVGHRRRIKSYPEVILALEHQLAQHGRQALALIRVRFKAAVTVNLEEQLRLVRQLAMAVEARAEILTAAQRALREAAKLAGLDVGLESEKLGAPYVSYDRIGWLRDSNSDASRFLREATRHYGINGDDR
jgi:Skp family chaperone for outer membrane proteins